MQRIVPRRDGEHDADRLAHDERIADALFPLELPHELRVVREIRDRQPDLDAASELERHADFLCDGARKLVGARLEAFGYFLQVVRPRRGRQCAPGLERSARGAHGSVGVALGARGDAAHHRAVARVVHVDHFAARGRDPLSADEKLVLGQHGDLRRGAYFIRLYSM